MLKSTSSYFVLAFAIAGMSSLAHADYDCDLTLSKAGKVVAQRTVSASNGVMSGGYLGDLYVEKQVGSLEEKGSYESEVLQIGGYMNGWDPVYQGQPTGGQSATLSVVRIHVGVSGDHFVPLSGDQQYLVNRLEFVGEHTREADFENYHLKMSCHPSPDKKSLYEPL